MDSLLIPVRIFREEDAAIDWLSRFLDHETDSQR